MIKYKKQVDFSLLITVIFSLACNQNSSSNSNSNSKQIDTARVLELLKNEYAKMVTHRLSFRNISEIISDSSYSSWVELRYNSASLMLHFQYKDTLAISYSPECWMMFPYKLEENKIIVYWDKNIDTKYNFDIVKAVNKTPKKFIGKPFMTLELVNDTTLKATYLLKEMIKKINHSSREGTFFPEKYIIAQEGYF